MDALGIGPAVAPATLTASRALRLGSGVFAVDTLDLPVKGEDALLVADGHAVVADGATAVVPGGPSVADFTRNAVNALHRHRELPVRDRFRAAIGEVAVSGSTIETPCCTVASALARDDRLEVSVLCDASAFVLCDGVVVPVVDDRLAALDARTENRIATLMAAGMSFADARAAVTPLLRRQRQSAMNREGGYWVFAADPAAADHVITASFPLQSVDAVLLCSDGFARLWEKYGALADGGAALRAALRPGGLGTLGRRLRRIENAPGTLETHPRTSREDDATAVLLRRPQPARR